MKPLYLEMNYFGPHEHSIIDFSKLEEAPIFLISGDTGAGKSTIFDAITFALFGSATSDRDAKEMRSQFATSVQKTSVTFYFEQGNFIYKVYRQPDQEIKKQRGEGTKLEKSNAHLSIVESIKGSEIKNIASKPSDVGKEVGILLNLNAEQFKKIVLLPQNDFSKFLKSKTDEKEAILKKIFGTALFTSFSDEIKERYNQVNNQNKQFVIDLDVQYKSQVWTKEEQEKLEKTLDVDRFKIISEFQKERHLEMKTKQQKASELKEIKDKAELDYQAALEIDKKFNEKVGLEEEYNAKIIEQSTDFLRKSHHLKELKWSQDFRDTMIQLENIQTSQERTAKSEREYQQAVTDGEKKIISAQAEVEKLQSKAADFDKMREEVEKLSIQIPQAEEAEEIGKELTRLKDRQKDCQNELMVAQEEKDKLNSDIFDNKQKVINIEQLSAIKSQLNDLQLEFSQSLIPVSLEFERLTKEVADCQNNVGEVAIQVQKSFKKMQDSEKEYEIKIKNRRSLMIAQLQKELVDGEPCQVCGSKEHLSINSIDVSNEELKKAMDQVDKSQKDFAASETTYKQQLMNAATSEENWKTKKEEVKSKKDKLTQLYDDFRTSQLLEFPIEFNRIAIKYQMSTRLAELSAEEKVNKKLQVQIDSLESQVHHIEQKIHNLSTQLAEINSKIEVQSENEEKKKGFGSSEKLKDSKANLTKEIECYDVKISEVHKVFIGLEKSQEVLKARLEESQSQMMEITQKIKGFQKEIHQKISDPHAFSQELDVINKWLKEDSEQLSNQIETYKQDKLRLEQAIEVVSEHLKGSEKPDISVLKSSKEVAEYNHVQMEKELSVIDSSAKQAHEIIQKVTQILKKQGNLASETEEITRLWNAINGKSVDKLKLETYVVQSYLEKVLEYANNHFINVLSNNRYQFELSERVRGNGSQGLDINVYDNETGSMRSSNTLSGGETFIAALSIALSLSEVVQNSAHGVQIEALFVDEGFGSLDHETLQKAMMALEQIGENRIVGVISHVEEMKKSIGQQLLIKKIGDGRSCIEVVTH